jgi:DNA mismatch repair protein MutL
MLDPLVAQRIAAGEVIDRPAAIVRELLDNAIDAGATHIEVYLEQGGIDMVKVIDDGSGMDREDLQLCCKSHATSKVSSVEDLEGVDTLGFRGEALASIAACTRLTVSSRASSGETYTLTVKDGIQEGPVLSGHAKGTTVTAQQLFHAIPGRKKFLKSAQAESAACKRVFLEKTLAFPEIEFKYTVNEKLILFLPATGPIQRIIDAHPGKFDQVFFDRIDEQAGSFTITGICSTPSLYRNDRSFIQIFINNRKVDEYALMQAVQYGYRDYLPGGCFPYAFIFITVLPELVDVNIHPAKREVKLRNGKEIHHQLVQSIRTHLSIEQRKQVTATHLKQQDLEMPTHTHERPAPDFSPGRSPVRPSSKSESSRHSGMTSRDPEWFQKARDSFSNTTKEPVTTPQRHDVVYYGQLFGLFLLAEKEGTFYFIDQHAVHERIIYNELVHHPGRQELLVPIEFTVEEDVDIYLRDHPEAFGNTGITVVPVAQTSRTWQITTVPQYARYREEQIVVFIQEHVGREEDVAKELFANIACRAAVKDGDLLDHATAAELTSKAFDLPVPRCPHGRPIWKVVTRDELFEAVQRIV